MKLLNCVKYLQKHLNLCCSIIQIILDGNLKARIVFFVIINCAMERIRISGVCFKFVVLCVGCVSGDRVRWFVV